MSVVESLLFLSIGVNVGMVAGLAYYSWKHKRHMNKTKSFVKANEEEYYTEYGNGEPHQEYGDEPVRGKNVY